MVSTAPRFLFIPVSGPGGAGEYFRSLAIARGLERRWPGCRIRFVLDRSASYARTAPYEVLPLDDSPTRSSARVIEYIRSEQPDVAVFDSSGRAAQYRAASASGARVVFVSSRPTSRWKGFRLGRMRLLDQHWIAQPRFLDGGLTRYERLKLRLLGRPEVVWFDAMHEPIDVPATTALQSRLGLQPGHYVAMCPGGGGNFGHAIDANQVFVEAAERLVHSEQMPVVVVLGAASADVAPAAPAGGGVRTVGALPNGQLLGLLRDAAVVAVNGGSLLVQCMAQALPIVAAPIAGDQARRIRGCADYIVETTLDAEAMAAAVAGLLHDPAARERLRLRLVELGLRNGVDVVTDAVARLLDGRAMRAVPDPAAASQ